MTGLFSALIDYMEEEDWKYEILEGETIIRFHFKGSAGRLLCYGEVDEEKCWLIFYSYMPVNAPPEKMAQAAEFVARANRGMRIGNFELDFDDGEIRYKTSIDVEGGELSSKMIDNLLRANLSTINRYFAGLMELIYGEKPAADVIKRIETPRAGRTRWTRMRGTTTRTTRRCRSPRTRTRTTTRGASGSEPSPSAAPRALAPWCGRRVSHTLSGPAIIGPEQSFVLNPLDP